MILDVILSKRHGLAQFIRRLRVNSKLAHTLFIPAIVLQFGLDDEAAMIDIHASMNFEFRKEILKNSRKIARPRRRRSSLRGASRAAKIALPRRTP